MSDQQSNPANQENTSQEGQGNNQGQLAQERQMAENQVDQAIDQLANKVPGGAQYAQKAKDEADVVLNNLEGELEKRLGNAGGLLGGLFGGHKDNQGNQQ